MIHSVSHVVDLAPCLTQVLLNQASRFQSRSLSVSGSRRLAALVRDTIQLYIVTS